jgi:hypothetical protein
VAVADAPIPSGRLPWTWGTPVGSEGPASAVEARQALREPRTAAGLLGSFVLLGEAGDGLRLLSSADVVHTLARCTGPAGTAWSTKSWAGLLATQAEVSLAWDRVPEYVLHDQVWGDDELLVGPRLCEEAHIVDIAPNGVTEGSWWPVAERMGPGDPSDGASVRAALTDEIRRVARVPTLVVALTAGRDSTLVAAALHDAGAAPPTYTFGQEGDPDHDGAARTAGALGFRHLAVQPAPGPPRDFDAVVRATAWTEGLDTAWNSLGSPLLWPPAWCDRVHLSGSGGETGRAFYYQRAGIPTTIDDALSGLLQPGLHLPAHTRRTLTSRLAPVVEDAFATARDAPRTLDLLYVRNRMRSWLNRTLPSRSCAGVISAYTSPRLVQALLDLPLQERFSGSGFDRALGTDGRELRRAALEGTGPSGARRLLAAAGVRTSALSGRVRGGHRLHRLIQRAVHPPDRKGPALLASCLAGLPAGLQVIPRALGPSWWEATMALAPHESWARRQLWNALAVEALVTRIQL